MTKKEWEALVVVAQIGAALAAAHGLKSKNWSQFHTACVVVGAIATVGRLVRS